MILTGPEIERQIDLGEITIFPFDRKNLGPNSYDVTLHRKLRVYELPRSLPLLDSNGPTGLNAWHDTLDMMSPTETREIEIPEYGFDLVPGQLYLGMSNETAVSKSFVPMLEGRSSVARLGMRIHATAGFGDIGWGYNDKGECTMPTWTLEIDCVRPVRIYPNVRIGQVYFLKSQGELKFYNGKYSNQKEPQSSLMFKDFKKND